MSLATTEIASEGPKRNKAKEAVNTSLRQQLTHVGLHEGSDWQHFNDADQGQISIVVFREAQILTEPVLLAAARALDGLDWELFLAIDRAESETPTPVVMVNRYVLSPMPLTPPDLSEVMSKVSRQLFAEFPSEHSAE